MMSMGIEASGMFGYVSGSCVYTCGRETDAYSQISPSSPLQSTAPYTSLDRGWEGWVKVVSLDIDTMSTRRGLSSP